MTSSKPRTRTPAAEVRGQLIAAGRRILERDGAPGLTVRAVAAEAGVAPMGVYNHFDGKDGLLDAVVTDGFLEFGRAVAATDDDPVARLQNSGRAYRRFALTNPTLYSLMFSSTCNPDPAAAAHSFAVLADIIRYAQVAGLVRAGDPRELAMYTWSCVHGAVSLELAGANVAMAGPGSGDCPVEQAFDGDANYEGVLALVAAGLAAPTD